MQIGRRVRELRKMRGWSQEKLGDKVGLSKSQISNIELNRRGTRVETQIRIAEALGVEVADLYESKMQVNDGWIAFNEKMKEKGITPEKAERWMELAEQIIKDSEK